MSGTDDQVLEVAEPAIWATDSGAKLGPHDGAGPTYTEMFAGWQVSDRPPARWLNWLFHAAGDSARAVLGAVIADWHEWTTWTPALNTTGAAMVHHPEIYGALGVNSQHSSMFAWLTSAGATEVSRDGGFNWLTGTALAAFTLNPNAFSRDSARVAWGDGANVRYTNSVILAGSATQATGLNVVGALSIAFRDASDYAVAADDQGNVAYNATDVATAAWTLATTQPSAHGSWDTTGIRSLCYLGNNTYLAVTQGGQVFRSVDGGDVWALLSTLPTTPASGNCNFMSRCPHTGTIVATRDHAGSGSRAYYSHDNGSSWTASLTPTFIVSGPNVTALKTVGGGAFMMADSYGQWWSSLDRGQSWYLQHASGVTTTTDKIIRAFGCDGKRIIALWEDGVTSGVIHSGCLDGRGSTVLS